MDLLQQRSSRVDHYDDHCDGDEKYAVVDDDKDDCDDHGVGDDDVDMAIMVLEKYVVIFFLQKLMTTICFLAGNYYSSSCFQRISQN